MTGVAMAATAREVRRATLDAVPTAPVATGSLVAGYGIPRMTGRRPLGGVVFAAGTAWCAREWVRQRGAPAAVALTGVQFCAFFASHRLARKLGSCPSVLTTSLRGGAAATLVVDRR